MRDIPNCDEVLAHFFLFVSKPFESISKLVSLAPKVSPTINFFPSSEITEPLGKSKLSGPFLNDPSGKTIIR